jgi:hypothetical protein
MDHLADAPVANILILAGIIFLAVGIFGRIGGFIGSIFGNIEAGKNSRVLAGVLGAILVVGGGWLHQDSHKSVGSNPSPADSVPATGTTPPSVISPSATPAAPPDGTRDAPKAAASTHPPSPKKAPPASGAPAPAAERENLPRSSPTPVVDDRLVGTWSNLKSHSDSIKRIEIARDGQGLTAHLWYDCRPSDCDQGFHRLHVSGDTSTYEHADSNRRRLGHLTLQSPAILLLSVDISEPGTERRWHNNWVLVKSTAEKMQSAFSKYLQAPTPKAFAISNSGSWAYHLGGSTSDEATSKALTHCEKYGKPGCRIILLNDDPIE